MTFIWHLSQHEWDFILNEEPGQNTYYGILIKWRQNLWGKCLKMPPLLAALQFWDLSEASSERVKWHIKRRVFQTDEHFCCCSCRQMELWYKHQ